MSAPRPPKPETLRLLTREPGGSASERLASFLVKVFGDAVGTCANGSLSDRGVEEMGQRLSDAHFAFSGGLWLERTVGVQRERFLRHKLVETVIHTGEFAAGALADRLAQAAIVPSEDRVRASLTAMALTIFATYDFGRVTRFQNRGNEHLLDAALHAVRSRRSRWPAMLPLVAAMEFDRPKDPLDLKNDVSRMRRLISAADPPLYRVMPPGVNFSFQLLVEGETAEPLGVAPRATP